MTKGHNKMIATCTETKTCQDLYREGLIRDLETVSRLFSFEVVFGLIMAILLLPLVLVLTMGASEEAKAIWFLFVFIVVGYSLGMTYNKQVYRARLRKLTND